VFSRYIEEMYPKDKNNNYPYKLCEHLVKLYLFDKIDKEIKFLDIGSGRGTHIMNFMKFLKGEFHGIDYQGTEIQNIKVIGCNLEHESLPYKDNVFDIIFSKSVLEHVCNTDNFISEAHRVLKPGGTMIIMVPDWQSQMKNFYDDYTHIKPFTIRSIHAALRINGFENVNVSYFRQLPVVWRFPFLKTLCDVISFICPESFKWKSQFDRNTKDRKWIRFSKEKMLLGVCVK
jgi:SAM-dependent methyltransferase